MNLSTQQQVLIALVSLPWVPQGVLTPTWPWGFTGRRDSRKLSPCPGSLPEAMAALVLCWPWSCLLVTEFSGHLELWQTLATVTAPALSFLFGQLSCNSENIMPWAHDNYKDAQAWEDAQKQAGLLWRLVERSAEKHNANHTGINWMGCPVNSIASHYGALMPSSPHTFWEDREETKLGLQRQNYCVGPALYASIKEEL